MVNNIHIEVLASIARQERETIKKRQAEGIAAAKEKGKHLGRPALIYPENLACSSKPGPPNQGNGFILGIHVERNSIFWFPKGVVDLATP